MSKAIDFAFALCYHIGIGLKRSRTQRLFVYPGFFVQTERRLKGVWDTLSNYDGSLKCLYWLGGVVDMNDSKAVLKNFVKYVSLNILGQMAYSCYTLADTFFVSARLGANGLTALNLAFPVFCLLNGTGLMIGMGGGTRYSIAKSRGENEKASRIFTKRSIHGSLFRSSVFFNWRILVRPACKSVRG